MRGRGQSEAVGTVLMAGIAVVVVAGLVVTGSSVVNDAQRDAPSAALDVRANGTSLSVTHTSGDALAADEVTAVLTGDGSTRRLQLSAFDERGDGDARVVSGETFRTTYTPPSTSFTLRLVHGPSELVIAERALSVARPGIDFSAGGSHSPSQTPYNVNDPSGSVTVTDGGSTVKMEGNRWAEVDYSYTITPETVLSFTFESDNECEIHAIGFADSQNERRMVRVFGTQNWGTRVDTFAGQQYYDPADGRVDYTVPIGQLYDSNGQLGGDDELDANHVVFVNDCDGGGAVDSRFGTVRVYESS